MVIVLSDRDRKELAMKPLTVMLYKYLQQVSKTGNIETHHTAVAITKGDAIEQQPATIILTVAYVSPKKV